MLRYLIPWSRKYNEKIRSQGAAREMRCPLAFCLAVGRELHDAGCSLVYGIDLEVIHSSPVPQPDCFREIRPPRRVVNYLAGAAVYGFPAQPEGLKPVLWLRHSPDTGPESGTEGSGNVLTHFLDGAPLLVCLKHGDVRSDRVPDRYRSEGQDKETSGTEI